MTRLVQGPIYLDGSWHHALAFDSKGVVALDDEALQLEITPERVTFFTRAFHDAHAHPVLAGRDLLGLNVTNCQSVAEVQQTVASYLKGRPQQQVIVGGSYDRSIAPGGMVKAQWLDEVTGNQALALHANDHHTLWVNSAALALIPEDQRQTEGVDLEGILRESAAKDLVLGFEERIDAKLALKRAHEDLLAAGVTSLLDAYVDNDILAAYESTQLLIETECAFSIEPESYQSRLTELAELLPNQKAKAVKFFLDGAFGNATAAVSSEYDTGGTGSLYWANKDLIDCIRKAGELGLAAHIHAIGDRAVEQAIDCLERSGFATGSQIAHAELATDAAFSRMSELGIEAVVQPLWGRKDGLLQSCAHHLGSRVESLYQTRRALELGVTVRFGSDWPVSSADPLEGLYTAVYRDVPGVKDSVLGIDQSISLQQALSAYQRPFGADFVQLSGNPFAEALTGIFVTETIIGGQTKFARQ